MEKECPICQRTLINSSSPDVSGVTNFRCLICGRFSATSHYILSDTKEDVHLIQGALRERKINNLPTILFYNKDQAEAEFHLTEKELLKSVKIPKNPAQKIEKFLENLALIIKDNYAQEIPIKTDRDYPICYAKDSSELWWVITIMKEQEYCKVRAETRGNISLQLTFNAWKKIEELKHVNKKSKQGFIACSFNEDHASYIESIENGIKNAGFEPMCIKEKYYENSIMDKALSEIRKSRFVIVDLTYQSNPVSFESGYAFGIKTDCIFIIHQKDWGDEEKKKKIGFYEKHYKINIYKDEKDLEKKIELAIKATISIKN